MHIKQLIAISNRYMLKGIPVVLLMTFFSTAEAQSSYSLKSITGSVSGTSTLHNWKSAVTKVQFKGLVKKDGVRLGSVSNVEIKIPVTGIVSTEGKSMDKKTYKAFNSDKNPFIVYVFNTSKVGEDGGHIVSLKASGDLSMAGVTLPETLTAIVKMLPGGDMEFVISKKLKMTEFKMKPPTALMGTIKSGDEITLDFDMILTPVKAVALK